MKKLANVVMLPTEKASLLALNKGKLFLSESKLDYIRDLQIGTQPQHLYVTTDEEIKEGDWMIHTQHNTLLKCEVGEAKHFVGHLYLRKIVATTDPELFQTNMSMNAQGYDFFGNYIGLPKIPTDFIEAYVREQGKMSHVMLEYDEKIEAEVIGFDPHYGRDMTETKTSYNLKLRPNGTVIWSLNNINIDEQAENYVVNAPCDSDGFESVYRYNQMIDAYKAGWEARGNQ